MSDLAKQRQEIETMRLRLNDLVVSRQGNFTHPDVMHLSAQLDHLIVEYQLLARKQGSCLKTRWDFL